MRLGARIRGKFNYAGFTIDVRSDSLQDFPDGPPDLMMTRLDQIADDVGDKRCQMKNHASFDRAWTTALERVFRRVL